MSGPTSARSVLPQPDPEVLAERLSSLCAALGATRMGVARRMVLPPRPRAPVTLEVLAAVGEGRALDVPEAAVPLTAFQRMADGGRVLEIDVEEEGPLPRWLRRRGLRRLLGWPLPEDRLPCVFMVALYAGRRDLRPERLRVAREGMAALARSLAPPAWLLLAGPSRSPHSPTRRGGPGVPPAPSADTKLSEAEALQHLLPLQDAVVLVEKMMIRRALQCAEGNKSAAARALRMSRQGLYKKLKRHGFL